VITKNGKVTYLNSGDWVENLTALEFDNGAWKIFQYDEKEFEKKKAPIAKITKKLPQLNVATDEIAFFINSLTVNA
jgi:hypothetical protein